jgi:hypothetical protein
VAEVNVPPLPEEDRPEELGVYFKCLRRDSENLALTEPDAFVVQDAKGRNWMCYALGMGLPIVWTGHKEDLAGAHFDTSHLNHIVWEQQ